MMGWQEIWSKNLFKFYCILSILFFIGILYFGFAGPIEIAQICGLAMLWTVFGAFINRY